MGMIFCKQHGWSGVASLTPKALKAIGNPAGRLRVVPVELIFDDVPFYVYATDDEFPTTGDSLGERRFVFNDEQHLNSILNELSPMCGSCVVDILARRY